jgi:hypothetical protein
MPEQLQAALDSVRISENEVAGDFHVIKKYAVVEAR